MLAVTKARKSSIDRTQTLVQEKHQMVTLECPWCAEPAEVDTMSPGKLSCETCRIVVEIAPDPLSAQIDRAA
jgi:transcription elongation factor Elf1